jgi:co-chaperonin GroES (HSP10)
VIVTRATQITSKLLVIPDTYRDPRTPHTADRGIVLAAGASPKGLCDELRAGEEVFYLGPADKLAVKWDGQDCYVVHYSEVLGVVE